MKWDQLTSPEIEALDKTLPVVLPVAATEQHGGHLPLATDRLIAEFFCESLDTQIPDDVLLLPTVAIGCSAHHLDFPGTLSLSHETFLRVCEDILSCVAKAGFRNLIVFNAHGGNQAIGSVLLEKFGHANPDCRVVLVTWWKLAPQAMLALNESGAGGAGHAGEFETSLLLHFACELVRNDAMHDGEHAETFAWNESDMLRGPRAVLYRSLKQMSANGVFGKPEAASAEKGKHIAAHVIDAFKQIVNDLRTST